MPWYLKTGGYNLGKPLFAPPLMPDTIEVFISYSKQDKELRDGLLAHLRPLERQGIITRSERMLQMMQWSNLEYTFLMKIYSLHFYL